MCQSELAKSDIISVVEPEDDDGENLVDIKPTLKQKLQSGLNPKGLNSTKVTALLADLKQVKIENDRSQESPVKSVIFSQWTSMLDLIEVSSLS